MKLLPWRLRTHKPTASAPQFVPALDRVREMREHTTWEPVTSPENIQERAERVAAARQHVTIPPLGSEHQAAPSRRSGLDTWRDSLTPFLFGVLAMLIVVALVVHVFRPEPERVIKIDIKASTVAFPLPDRYPYASLTDDQAIQFARRALKGAGLNLNEWGVDYSSADYRTYLRRIGNFEGILVFRRWPRDFFEDVEVTVKLEPEEKRVVCTINPQ